MMYQRFDLTVLKFSIELELMLFLGTEEKNPDGRSNNNADLYDI